MKIEFLAGQKTDVDYCRRLYFQGMDEVKSDLEDSFHQRWVISEVRIILCDGATVGWLQCRQQDGSLFLVQLIVEASCQGRGIGTDTMLMLMRESATNNCSMTLGVVKSNPARRLYERLRFRITHEDDRKFYMKWAFPDVLTK